MSSYEVVIGLEVHTQLLTQSKAFCPSSNDVNKAENSQVGPVSAGLPGALPVLNKKAVELAVKAGLALNCNIRQRSLFARKNYFYPDSPKGYQISQHDLPLCYDGFVNIGQADQSKQVRIERIHMEEDAGRLLHALDSTLINLNRSGVPLVEIVSHPDLSSASEVVEYLKKLHAILVFAGVTDGNMEEGHFRCDVNISVRPRGQKMLGTRTELKNLNSFRFIEKAIEYESARQIAVLEAGSKIVQETRGWDAPSNKTFPMRSKEEAADYRYFPDPDLPPLVLGAGQIEELRNTLPELPEAMNTRFQKEYTLSVLDADVLTSNQELSFYFEECVRAGANPKSAVNWLQSELLREWHERGGQLKDFPVGPVALSELLLKIQSGEISGKIAKKVFVHMLNHKVSAQNAVQDLGLIQVNDQSALESWVEQVLINNPQQVEELKQGKGKVMAFFVGQIMKLSKGQANPALVNQILKKKLGVNEE